MTPENTIDHKASFMPDRAQKLAVKISAQWCWNDTSKCLTTCLLSNNRGGLKTKFWTFKKLRKDLAFRVLKFSDLRLRCPQESSQCSDSILASISITSRFSRNQIAPSSGVTFPSIAGWMGPGFLQKKYWYRRMIGIFDSGLAETHGDNALTLRLSYVISSCKSRRKIHYLIMTVHHLRLIDGVMHSSSKVLLRARMSLSACKVRPYCSLA